MNLNLEAHLYNSHRQPCLLGQLLSDVSRGLRRLIEGGFEDLQLLSLDCRPWSPSLRSTSAVIRTLVLARISAVWVTVQGALARKERVDFRAILQGLRGISSAYLIRVIVSRFAVGAYALYGQIGLA